MLKEFTELVLPSEIKNFTSDEFSCSCCGEVYEDINFYLRIQEVRNILGKPVSLNSCHRCLFHNFEVGGVVTSQHLENASDISLVGLEPLAVLLACLMAGFTGFGFYGTFLHVDLGEERFWVSLSGKRTWRGISHNGILLSEV